MIKEVPIEFGKAFHCSEDGCNKPIDRYSRDYKYLDEDWELERGIYEYDVRQCYQCYHRFDWDYEDFYSEPYDLNEAVEMDEGDTPYYEARCWSYYRNGEQIAHKPQPRPKGWQYIDDEYNSKPSRPRKGKRTNKGELSGLRGNRPDRGQRNRRSPNR